MNNDSFSHPKRDHSSEASSRPQFTGDLIRPTDIAHTIMPDNCHAFVLPKENRSRMINRFLGRVSLPDQDYVDKNPSGVDWFVANGATDAVVIEDTLFVSELPSGWSNIIRDMARGRDFSLWPRIVEL